MEGSEKKKKKALDDIFGDDVIEIDTSSTTDEAKQEELSKTYLNIPLEESSEINIPDVSETTDEAYDEVKNDNNIKNDNDDYTDDSNVIIKDSKNNKLDIKKIIIYFIIGFIIGITLIYVIVNYVVGKEKVVNCSYTAEDVGYKVTDEYKITYKNNEILYVESTYNYEAKTDEYKNQIEYIKDEKLPVIINSNGMSGFTYVYETSDDYFKVMGYLDFTLFNYDKINKIDQNITPISYFKIDSDNNFNSFKESLEKQGYNCTISK